MSRRAQQAPVEVIQDEVEEEEILSETGEGDEIMEDIDEQRDGDSSSTPTSTLTWISWFCCLPGHEYFCEVSEDFIEDDFNLTGLNLVVPFWKEAMEMVLDVEPDEDTTKIPDVSIVEASAELLYGLVHQRYVLTRAGLQAMVDKYEGGMFGSCPRVYCHGCNVLPCGRSDLPGLDTVKLFCPNCNDIYTPPSSRFQGVDGAFFGTTFAHLFFQSYRELAPAPFWKPPSPSSSSVSPRSSGGSPSHTSPFINPNPYGGQKQAEGRIYVPKIYGFKVSERAKSGPRMQWMRLRPWSAEELEDVDWKGRWLDDDEDYEEDDDDIDDDRPMEDFADTVDGPDDDEEEEEEEELQEPSSSMRTRTVVHSVSAPSLRPPTPVDKSPSSSPYMPHGRSARPLVEQFSPGGSKECECIDLRYGLNKGHPTTPIAKSVRPSQRKGIQSERTKVVRSVVREVAGFSPYERRVMELLRNSKDKKARKLTKKRLGTLLRSKRKLEELGTIIQESRRTGH
ncbi:uncharacterized protein FIBRA_05294 [Fibroporia radiculosa]|uniref:Multifunctional fusion protein n=1 Tax=Fibroporia radiculosa TaxID=599839 RepID=J4HX99_9APHY|nr:uncharacterized protein FIBRA_05294 [Fibroporia radiculosa]CCM03172.1 predicted protein [Fibroporia radiculosa]